MRNIILIVLVLMSGWAAAQITVTSATLPVVGDTLFVGVNNNPANIDISGSGPNNSWDLSNVSVNFITQTIFIDPSLSPDAADFPEADLFVELADSAGGIFYRRSGGTIYEIGRTGLDPITNNLPLTVINEGDAVYRKTPLAYELEYSSDFSFNISFSGEIIPDTLLQGLPIAPDSVRISFASMNDYQVDAWGTLKMPDGTHDVLRERVVTTTDIGLEIKTFIGWIVIDPALLGDFGELFESTIVESYRFYSDDSKEILATVTVDEDGVASRVELKSRDIISSVVVLKPNQKDVFVNPNPSFGYVDFVFANMDKGKYTIQVSSILGKVLHKKEYWVEQNDRISENFSYLKKGTYIYSVIDDKGKRIATKRLVIITP